jgi:hypothetical protein
MEASVHGVRMMALGTTGERPAWMDFTIDIDRDGQKIELRSERKGVAGMGRIPVSREKTSEKLYD